MCKVLVVDADSKSRAEAVERIRATGHEVVEAYDGLSALDVAEEMKPDVIILDWVLPQFFGVEVAEILVTDSRFADLRKARIFFGTYGELGAPWDGSARVSRSSKSRTLRENSSERPLALGFQCAYGLPVR